MLSILKFNLEMMFSTNLNVGSNWKSFLNAVFLTLPVFCEELFAFKYVIKSY
jgi:hypothetical protein